MAGLNKFKVRILALIWVIFGVSLTSLFVFYINSINKKFEKKVEKKVVEIKTAPKKKLPKKIEKKVVKKVKKQTKPLKQITPPPSLSEGISGVEVNIPQFSVDSNLISSDTKDIVGNVNENVIMTSESVDQPPMPVQRVAPEYPKVARARGITGYVTFSLLIDENGNVVKAEILEPNPKGVFDQAALNAIKQWKFESGKYKGKPVKVWVKQTIKFQLQ